MPETLNRRKSNKIGDRQRQLAKKWRQLGLLNDDVTRLYFIDQAHAFC
ncbi:MAG: hypothetical protein R3F19_05745 [Verrucomicrobiales bacterium]